MKTEIECKLTKKQLKIIYDTFCVYENGSETGEIPLNCDKCILRKIEYVIHGREADTIRDLCFAIYHDGMLTDNPIQIHH